MFLLPAACSAEKDGTFVNSSRWLQWKWKALDPPGQARPDQEIIALLFLKLRELYRNEGGDRSRSTCSTFLGLIRTRRCPTNRK